MKGIAAKLVQIMGECSYVQKTGKNKFHGYNYATAADVLEKVSESCVKHGVATFANAEIMEWKPIEKHGKDGTKTEFFATVKVAITAIDQDTGETVTFSGVGCGQDVGDKAVMKAETAAVKYAWMTTLNIATGDDPEADETTDRRNAGQHPAGNAPLPSPQPPQPAKVINPGEYPVTMKNYTGPLKGMKTDQIKWVANQYTGRDKNLVAAARAYLAQMDVAATEDDAILDSALDHAEQPFGGEVTTY